MFIRHPCRKMDEELKASRWAESRLGIDTARPNQSHGMALRVPRVLVRFFRVTPTTSAVQTSHSHSLGVSFLVLTRLHRRVSDTPGLS